MKNLLLALLLAPSIALAGWLSAGQFYIPDGLQEGQHNLIFINTHSGHMPIPENQWVSVDTTPNLVPQDATAVLVQGTLIITHGTTPASCDLQIYVRKPGTTYSAFGAFGQVVETQVGGGQRSPWSFVVPVKDGKFEFWWQRSTQGSWPTHCAYGINLRVAGYWK